MRLWAVLRALVPALCASDRGPALVAAFRRLDGAWLKIGQTMSFRTDLFSHDVCEALSVLQGDKGVASIGTVTREGDRAIKVIPAGRREIVERDLQMLHRIGCITDRLPVLRRLCLREAVDEIGTILRQELDLRIEAANQMALRKQLKGRKGLYVGKVYTATADRLEMDWIDGTDVSHYLSNQERWPDGKRRSKSLLFALLRMIFEDNRFHGDLHPGNVRVMPDGRLALLDCGTIGVTEGAFLRHFAAFVQALVDREWKWAADKFVLLQRHLVPLTSFGRFWKAAKLARIQRDLVRVIERWAAMTHVKALPYHERSLNTLTQRMVKVTALAGGSLEWAWLAIQRALASVERMLEVFWPEIDFLKVAARYVKQAKRRNPLAFKDKLSDVLDMGVDYLDTLTNQGVRIAL